MRLMTDFPTRGIMNALVFNRRLAIGMVLAAAFLGNPDSGLADELSHLAGSWRGSGAVDRADGTKERLRCEASYTAAAPSLIMSLKCASDSYSFNLQSNIRNDAGKLSGTWSETT